MVCRCGRLVGQAALNDEIAELQSTVNDRAAEAQKERTAATERAAALDTDNASLREQLSALQVPGVGGEVCCSGEHSCPP